METITRVLVALAFFAGSQFCQAMPIELNEVDFISATNPLSPTVETFEGFVVGAYDSPFVFSNGTYISSDEINVNPVIVRDAFSPSCEGSEGNCLGSRGVNDVRTFTSLPVGTQYWGASIFMVNEENSFDIQVVGGSGLLNLSSVSSTGFFGFFDPLGITSISFDLLTNGSTGTGNHSYDNVTTAGSSVPIAATPLLIIFGFLVLGMTKAKRRVRSKLDTSVI